LNRINPSRTELDRTVQVEPNEAELNQIHLKRSELAQTRLSTTEIRPIRIESNQTDYKLTWQLSDCSCYVLIGQKRSEILLELKRRFAEVGSCSSTVLASLAPQRFTCINFSEMVFNKAIICLDINLAIHLNTIISVYHILPSILIICIFIIAKTIAFFNYCFSWGKKKLFVTIPSKFIYLCADNKTQFHCEKDSLKKIWRKRFCSISEKYIERNLSLLTLTLMTMTKQ